MPRRHNNPRAPSAKPEREVKDSDQPSKLMYELRSGKFLRRKLTPIPVGILRTQRSTARQPTTFEKLSELFER